MHSLQQEAQRNHTSWDSRDVVYSIKKDIDFEEPIIRGPVDVAKGEGLILALNSEQMDAVGAIFDFDAVNIIMHDTYYASLESTGKDPKKVEVRLKFASVRPSTQNHLVISSAAAKGLEVEGQNKDIRITSVYQKVEDIDLDKL